MYNMHFVLFTGYSLSDFASIIPMLNGPLHLRQRDANKTIRNKYAHRVFFEVSMVPLLTTEQLLEASDKIDTL